MLALALHGGHPAQQPGRVRGRPDGVGGDDEIRHGGLAAGDGAGFVEQHGVHLVGFFQRLGVANQHTVFRPLARAHHDGRGRGQPQRAGAGNDEHRHEVDQCQRHPALHRRQIKPQHEGQDGNDHHRGHEHSAHPVGQPLNGGAAALGGFHQLHDLREQGVGAHLGDAKAEGAGFVEGGAEHRVAGLLGHRQALAGEHGLVHGRAAVFDEAVGGHLLAGAHHHEVAQLHLLDGHVHLLAVGAHQAGSFGLQAQQGFHGGRGLGFGAQLQHLAQQNQGDDGGRGVVIDLWLQPAAEEEARRHRGGQAVAKRCARAHGDERVHVGRAVLEAVPGRGIKLAPAVEQHRQREGQQQVIKHGHRHRPRKRPPQHEHTQRHDERRQHRRHRKAALEPGVGRGFLPVDFGLPFGGAGVGRPLGHGVAGAHHGGFQAGGGGLGGPVLHGGLFGGEVDQRALYARGAAEGFLDGRRARGAGHALNVERRGFGILRGRGHRKSGSKACKTVFFAIENNAKGTLQSNGRPAARLVRNPAPDVHDFRLIG